MKLPPSNYGFHRFKFLTFLYYYVIYMFTKYVVLISILLLIW